jgi:uncharacterized protein YbjT (DUF2867 family)
VLTPDRAWNRVQPIAVDDVLHFLAAALDLPAGVDRTFDVGGPDVLTYQGLATEYGRFAGLRRPLALPVPLAPCPGWRRGCWRRSRRSTGT